MSDSTAESGGDAGSNFIINAYNNSGSIDTPVSIARAAGGLITLARPTSLTNNTASTSTTTGSLINAGGFGNAGAAYIGGTIYTPNGMYVSGAGALVGVDVSSTTPQTRYLFRAMTGGSIRWAAMVSNAAEGGSDAGSPFLIGAFTDAGAVIDYPIQLNRASGSSIVLGGTTNRQVSIASTTASTSTTTGSLINSGGFGCAGAIWAGGVVSSPGVYGGIHCHDASAAQNIATGTTYAKLTCFTDNSLASNVTADATNDKITVTKAGKYRISGTISFTSGTNNVVFRFAPYVDGVEQDQIHAFTKIATGADAQCVHINGFATVAANKDIDLRCRHDNGGTVAITVVYANLNVEYLGE